MLLLALLPVLALLGFFGEQVNTVRASTPGVLVEVRSDVVEEKGGGPG